MTKNPKGLKVVVIDNYDSFTYNLVQYLGELGADLQVYRNDKITVEEIRKISPDRLVISPGPGTPEDAGISKDVIRSFNGEVPILGICLGHQSLGEVFGGRIIEAPELRHGKTTMIRHNSDPIFAGVDDPFEATRYHSLLVETESLPSNLEVTAWSDDGLIMGLKVKNERTYGVQFHPESIMTAQGKTILENFLC